MKTLLARRIALVRTLDSEAARSNAALGLYRVVMQHILISLYEWCVTAIRAGGRRPDGTVLPITEARRPTDGGMVTAVSELLIAAENLGWKNVASPWWETSNEQRPCWRILGSGRRNVENLLSSFACRRNNGIGHGLPGNYDSEADLDLLSFIINRFSHVLPAYMPATNKLVASGGRYSSELQLLRVVNGDPMLMREAKSIGNGRARVAAQVLTGPSQAAEFAFECDDVLGVVPAEDAESLTFVSTFDSSWNPLGQIPDRSTLEFSGRDIEIMKLTDWLSDTGSRACLLFGDGGVGKTTLLIEFLQRVVSGQVECEWKPDAIFYYTAKQTQWTMDGVRYIGAPRKGLSDALRGVASLVEGSLSREWFNCTFIGLSSKVNDLLMELGIAREKTLIVIDNAETLATSNAEVSVLSDELTSIVRKVGRVLLTSRRVERLEAKPIQIDALLESDALAMLRARGRALKRKQVDDAGDATLRGYARRLGRKPISLEVFVNAIEPGGSLEHAFNRVMRLQQSELGEFLFADAWDRMRPSIRGLLLLMTRISDVHDEVLLKLACQESGVSVQEAEDAFRESLGIATVVKASGHSSIAFSSEFTRYCTDRYEEVGGERLPTDAAKQRVSSRYGTYLKGVNAQLPSKHARAFRHAAARAAYAAASDGRVDDAILFYEEAVLADSQNAFLWDRYAFYLSIQRRLPEALAKASRATKLAPRDPSILFTRGMIESKLGNVVGANKTLGLAVECGALAHRCWLARAYAYFNASGRDYEQVMHCLHMAASMCPLRAYQREKHLAEVERLRARAVREMKREGTRA